MSRRDFLKGVGVCVAALRLPRQPLRAEAAAIRDEKQFYVAKIDHDSLPYKLFTAHGFEWGGDWQDRKDYQHFEIPTPLAEMLYPDNKQGNAR